MGEKDLPGVVERPGDESIMAVGENGRSCEVLGVVPAAAAAGGDPLAIDKDTGEEHDELIYSCSL